jgi:hypothetical protein
MGDITAARGHSLSQAFGLLFQFIDGWIDRRHGVSLSEGMRLRLQIGARITASQHAPDGCDHIRKGFTMDSHPRAAGASNRVSV